MDLPLQRACVYDRSVQKRKEFVYKSTPLPNTSIAFNVTTRDLGSGAGKGGGGGGAIREAGGAFGKQEAAREEEYFYKKQREQLSKLKEDLTDEISFHEEQIKRHQDAIGRHKKRVSDLDKKE